MSVSWKLANHLQQIYLLNLLFRTFWFRKSYKGRDMVLMFHYALLYFHLLEKRLCRSSAYLICWPTQLAPSTCIVTGRTHIPTHPSLVPSSNATHRLLVRSFPTPQRLLSDGSCQEPAGPQSPVLSHFWVWEE